MSKFFCLAALFYGSLVIGCEEGQLIRLRGSDCQYAECQGRKLVLIECKSNLLSSPGNYSCEHSECFVKGCQEDTFYSHYADNRAYYHCEKGKLVSKFCRKEENFDLKEERCRLISVNKEKHKNYILSDIHHDSRYETEIEIKCKDGTRRKKEGSCKQYYECKGETDILTSCLECENYDEKEKKCRYVFNTPCHYKAPIAEPGTTTCQAEVSPAQPSGHSSPNFGGEPTTEAQYTVAPTKEPHFTGEPTTEAQYTVSPTKESHFIGEPTTEAQYTVAPTKEPHFTGEPTTEAQYTVAPTKEPHFTGEPTTEAQYTVSPTKEPHFTGEPTTEAQFTVAPRTKTQTYSTVGNQTPFSTPSADQETLYPEPIQANCSQRPTRRALESNCKYYLECQNGELVTRKCGWFEHFDPENMACAFSLLVRCD